MEGFAAALLPQCGLWRLPGTEVADSKNMSHILDLLLLLLEHFLVLHFNFIKKSVHCTGQPPPGEESCLHRNTILIVAPQWIEELSDLLEQK